MPCQSTIKGRGTARNLKNRFEKLHYEYDTHLADDDKPAPETTFLRDNTKSIIAYNNSPDISFDASINVYRGCEHGCVYCYARPTHEYLGFSSGLDFETKILVKEKAPSLLREELNSKNYTPQILGMSGVTDPYQPVERKLKLTRQCLQVLLEFKNPIAMITKNYLVTRDIDILREMAKFDTVNTLMSITTFDSELRTVMEPRTSHPNHRLKAMEKLAQNNIPVGVLIAPVIPGLTDHEIPDIIAKATDAGAACAGYVLLRLPYANKELFSTWLENYYPDKKTKILNRIRSTREGKLNSTRFRERMSGKGNFARQISELFHMSCDKYGLSSKPPPVTTEHFQPQRSYQMSMF